MNAERAEAVVDRISELSEVVGTHEFGFQDPKAVGVPTADLFDRAVHAYGWRCAQAASGTATELIDDGDAVAAAVRDFSDFERATIDVLREAHQVFEAGA